MRKNKLVFGVGVNDADYPVSPRSASGRIYCNFYRKWADMLKRCYSEKFQNSSETYKGCSVCDEWLTFSNFKAWMSSQDWQGKNLDKDIIIIGNKVYSPEACAFVDDKTNLFVCDSRAIRGEHPIGVSFDKSRMRFTAKCCDPFGNSTCNLGRFSSSSEAHEAWRAKKHEIACKLADLQSDQRVAEALRTRYL